MINHPIIHQNLKNIIEKFNYENLDNTSSNNSTENNKIKPKKVNVEEMNEEIFNSLMIDNFYNKISQNNSIDIKMNTNSSNNHNKQTNKINSNISQKNEADIRPEPILPLSHYNLFELINWNEKEIARQLSLTTQFLYCKIQPLELILSSTNTQDKFSNSINIINIIDRFNKISLWIQEEILSYDNSFQRTLALSKVIDIITELRKMNNFNDAINLITAINSLPIKYLHKTFNKLDSNKKNLLKEHCTFFSSENNFNNLKEEIDKIIKNNNNKNSQNTNNEEINNNKNENNENNNKDDDVFKLLPCNIKHEYPCIPYFGLILKDLTAIEFKEKYVYFFEENNRSMINFNKILKINTLIDYFYCFKRNLYMFKPVFKLGFLSSLKIRLEDELISLSEKLGIFIKFFIFYIKHFLKQSRNLFFLPLGQVKNEKH